MENDMENMEMEMDYMERSRLRRQRISSAIKSAIAFLFSHLGLATMVIGYSIMGGFLFQALEAPNETREKFRIRAVKEAKIAEIRQLADLFCIRSISPENFTDLVNDLQVNFQTQVFLAVKNNGWDGKEETDEATTQWSFAGSLLYAVTVITTIGYGHVAPKTTSGRLVTILYALVGIPLTFLYLSNMGNFMAECFRLFYKKICCGMCIFCINRRQPLLDDEYERMEMAAQSNYAFHDADDDAKVATVYGDHVVDAMLRSTSRTHISSRSSDERDPAVGEGKGGRRRTSRTGWERHSISRSLKEDERDRRRVIPSNGSAVLDSFARNPKFQETQFSTRMMKDDGGGGGGGVGVVRERGDAPHGSRSAAETAKRYSTATMDDDGGETSSQKDERSPSHRKLMTSDFGKMDRLSCNRNRCSGPHDYSGRGRGGGRGGAGGGSNRNGERSPFLSPDKRRQPPMTLRRRHSFESGIGDAASASPLMFDKSVEVSEAQFLCVVGRDHDGLSAASSSFSPLFETNRSSDRVGGVKGRKTRTPTPSGESGALLPIESKYRSSASDISPNYSNATETSISESKDYIPLRRLPPSRSRAFVSTSQQGLSDQSTDVSWALNGVPQADGSKCVTGVETRNDADDDDDMDDEEEEEQERVIFGQMTAARRNRLSRSESVLDDAEVSVPISICLIIIGLYIFSGSLLFTVWEDWDYLTGSYFCFVTLSTIGFGDIVPGTDMKEWAASQKLILCSLWLVVGLSLLAMCFNLMQEEVKDKCKWIGRKLGILKDDD